LYFKIFKQKICRVGVIGLNTTNFCGCKDDDIRAIISKPLRNSVCINKINVLTGNCEDIPVAPFLETANDG